MDAMISLQCSSSESIAKELNNFLRSKGFTTWICMEMDGGATYREEIVVNASGSKTMIALMNVRWAESKECRYEFNIATRSNLTKGFPQIIPVILENFDFHKYPLITGVMANTNAIFYNAKDPNDTWGKVVAAVQQYVQPASVEVVTSVTNIVTQPVEVLPDKISDWTDKHVAQWIHSLGLAGSPKDAFLNNWVDGAMLMDLTEHEMQEAMKFTSLQTKRLMREITNFKNSKTVSKIPVATPTKAQQFAGGMFKVGSTVASTVVGHVPPAMNLLKSKKGFLTGVWEGHYEYDTGAKEKMSMDVTMIAGVIAGYGTDPTGDFLVQGTYEEDQLTCSWEKSYVGQHVVYYTGKLEGGKTIKGKWEIPGNWNGKFELTFKKAK